MRDEIKKLLPELEEIRDAILREKVADVWEDAIRTGGWQPAELALHAVRHAGWRP